MLIKRWFNLFKGNDYERRKFPRYDCSFKVSYMTQGTSAIGSQAMADNISRAGIRIRASRLIKKGDVVRMGIYPHFEEEPVTAVGVVKWTGRNNFDPKFTVDAGIKFLYIESFSADRLISLAQ